MTSQSDLGPLQRSAEVALSAAEALPVGAPFETVDQEADEAIATLRLVATEQLLPQQRLDPLDAAAIATLEMVIGPWRLEQIPAELAKLHDHTRASWPGMARLVRSAVARQLLRTTAETFAIRTGQDVAQLVGAWEARWESEVAGQLLGDPDLGQAARAFEDAKGLRERLDVVRAAHQEHARAEVARIEVERQAAQAAIQAADQQRRMALVQFFEKRQGQHFLLRNDSVVTGGAVANALRGHAAYNTRGEQIGPLAVDDADLLQRRVLALEAVA